MEIRENSKTVMIRSSTTVSSHRGRNRLPVLWEEGVLPTVRNNPNLFIQENEPQESSTSKLPLLAFSALNFPAENTSTRYFTISSRPKQTLGIFSRNSRFKVHNNDLLNEKTINSYLQKSFGLNEEAEWSLTSPTPRIHPSVSPKCSKPLQSN